MNFQAANEFDCPYCESRLGAAAGARPEHKPTDGQWTICNECSGICIYVINDAGVSLRKPTEQEIDEAKQQKAFWNEVEQMVDFVKSKPKK